MRVLCDEHVPPALVSALRSEGFEVETVGESVELGSPDADLLEFASDRGYAVLTSDSDFVDRKGHSGVLYYEDQNVSTRELVRAVRMVDDLLPDDAVEGETIFLPDGWT
ncbi:DUF5615 family PIN-like protein [Halosimplex halophilum]|uniref:DUF5615 family PIN-like protein n=1 Tax=Halosimplex halophilum TaxID=2559572 RepID=UPI00107FC52D|nr:DUF5615 family PIN-like protein [Halosimplex halophilum]